MNHKYFYAFDCQTVWLQIGNNYSRIATDGKRSYACMNEHVAVSWSDSCGNVKGSILSGVLVNRIVISNKGDMKLFDVQYWNLPNQKFTFEHRDLF